MISTRLCGHLLKASDAPITTILYDLSVDLFLSKLLGFHHVVLTAVKHLSSSPLVIYLG